MLQTLPLVLPDGKEYNLPWVSRQIYEPYQITAIVPDLPGLYFYVTDDDVVRYVGASGRLAPRMLASHAFRIRGGRYPSDTWKERMAFLPFSKKFQVALVRNWNSIQHGKRVVRCLHPSRELFYLEALCMQWFNPDLNGYKVGRMILDKWAGEFPEIARQFAGVKNVVPFRTA